MMSRRFKGEEPFGLLREQLRTTKPVYPFEVLEIGPAGEPLEIARNHAGYFCGFLGGAMCFECRLFLERSS